MKYILCITIFIPALIFSQLSLEKCLRKMGLNKENVVRSSESITLYPRTFAYNLNKPSSVAYFGCISTDEKSFDAYFKNSSQAVLTLDIGQQFVREAGKYKDTVTAISIDELENRIWTSDSTSKAIIDSTCNHLVVMFWNPDIMDRSIIKNYKYYKKFSNDHPELKIQIIAVLNEE